MSPAQARFAIRPMASPHRDAWLRMRSTLWPDASPHELLAEIDAFLARGSARQLDAVFVATAIDDPSDAVGFVELSIRSFAEGCVGERVAYVEGWFVEPGRRGHGIGRALIEAGERWAGAQRCHELASDAELDNGLSQAAHEALGFVETSRIVNFRKPL